MTEEVTLENNENGTEEIKNPEAVLAELRRAQADLKELRATVQSLTEERDDLAKQVEENPFKARAIEQATKSELIALGLNDPERLMKYIGREGIEFDDDGGLVGLNDRIDQLKADLPELFDVKRQVGGKADIFADSPVEHSKSTTESQVDALFA